MPTYNYKCSKCEHSWEEIRKIDNRRIPCENECPSCKEMNSVDIVIHASGFTDSHSLGRIKPPDDFRNFLKCIDKNNKNNTMQY